MCVCVCVVVWCGVCACVRLCVCVCVCVYVVYVRVKKNNLEITFLNETSLCVPVFQDHVNPKTKSVVEELH